MKLTRRAVMGSLLLAVSACSSSNDGTENGGGSSGNAGTGSVAGAGAVGGVSGGAGTGGVAASGGFGNASGFGNAGGFGNTSGNGSGGSGGSCASESATAHLQPVYLAFAFDVSGSMGKGDYDWHDRTLKWDPVVAATKAFFADPSTTGISASLTFFPAASDSCDAATYATPDVPMTELPSTAFAAEIDRITPMSSGDWRGGTPTLPVIDGTLAYLEPLADANPSAVHAIVLVTDGYPQSCSDQDNTIANVEAAVGAVVDRIPTYVIGVQNPPLPDAPDTVTDLNRVAVAGGTEQAFIIETGDPEQTASDLTAIINGIRQTAVSCSLEIPPPPAGQQFNPMRVNVNYTTGAGVVTPLGYDETCSADNAWRYDDAANPRAILLCDSTCAAVQADPAASLNVEFGCMTREPE